MGLKISSKYLCAFKKAINKMHVFIVPTYAGLYHNSTVTMDHSIPKRWSQQSATSHDTTLTACHLGGSENQDSSVNITPFQRARHHRIEALPTRVSPDSDEDDELAAWASLRRFLIVCAENHWLSKLIVRAAFREAGLRWLWKMWRS